MKFIPYPTQVEIKPLKKETVILGGKESLLEAGEVIQVGTDVTFLQVGDIVHFEAFGCAKTAKQPDGIEHYVVDVNAQVIRGKHARE